jgi:acetylornithine deacetylase
MTVDAAFVESTLAALIAIPSVNPAFSGGASDESAIAADVAGRLRALGMETETLEPEPGRASVVGRLRGGAGGRSLMLYAHLDTVGVQGMADPFAPAVREGRMYGRGAYDMKGGLAACIGAVRALRDAGLELAGDLLLVAVADEEAASLGMVEVLRRHRADAAVVTEPTGLDLCTAHKGFCWIEVETFGRAAHGSRFDEGVDANLRMGLFLARLAGLERELRERAPHPLLGPPSLHAPMLQGGVGSSTYSPHCRLEIERRTLPGEGDDRVLAEIDALLEDLRAADPAFRAERRVLLSRPGFEVAPDAAVVRAVSDAAAEVLGAPPRRVGASFWMDAALLAGAGIPTAVIGPDGAGAHGAEEWVELDSVVRLAEILAGAARGFCGAG